MVLKTDAMGRVRTPVEPLTKTGKFETAKRRVQLFNRSRERESRIREFQPWSRGGFHSADLAHGVTDGQAEDVDVEVSQTQKA